MPSWLTNKIVGYIGLGLITILAVALIWVTVSKNDTIHDQAKIIELRDRQITVLNRDLATCRSNTVTLEGAIARQNTAVNELRASSEARATQLAREAQAAQGEARRANERANRILSTSGSSCADADRLILENVR